MTGSSGVPSADNSSPPGGQSLQQAFEALVSTLNRRGVRYAIIGGLAIIQHTRVRTTEDIDALLAVPQVELPALFEALADRDSSSTCGPTSANSATTASPPFGSVTCLLT
jgi:hypothetical protein